MTAGRTFPESFLWGTATASYQVEGAASEDGRTPSIWDTFSHTPGNVLHGHTGDVAADQYHRYEEDVELMRQIALGAYRFSIAWPRIIPDASGAVNQKGIDYYRRLIDALHAAGIKAAATLYHWDLPQRFEDAGGWPVRDTALRFAEYAEVCYRELGDSVDMWITLNEPWCSAFHGYFDGHHAPGRRDPGDAFRATHHLMLAHGLAVERYRDSGLTAPIGITMNLESPRPATRRSEDVSAARRATEMHSLLFLNPILGLDYPEAVQDRYPDLPFPVEHGDRDTIAAPIDFLGLNYYHEPVIAYDPDDPTPEKSRVARSYHDTTEMEWPITPRGLYRHLLWVGEITDRRWPLYITENGIALPDELDPSGTAVRDPRRIAYMRDHFTAMLDAMDAGVDLRGYFAWTLLDNFEWAFGYTRRFGLVFTDYVSNRRVPKDSYYFFREVISGAEEF